MWSLWNEKYIIWHRFLEQVMIYWYWAWKHNFFSIKKVVFFFNISNRPNQLNRTAKNRTTIGRKTDLRRCASIPIMKKLISISSVINLEKNHLYWTTHTPTQNLQNDQNTLETQKMTNLSLKTQKMTKIPPNPKKWPKYHRNLKITKIPPKTQKITKIPPKPKNYQNPLKHKKMAKITPKPEKWPKYPRNLKKLPK